MPSDKDLQTMPSRNWPKTLTLGLQHVFAMFGATVLVPALTGLDTSVALFTAGAGTLLFHAVTKGKVPVFLGSSFAFIASIAAVMTEFKGDNPIGHVGGGIICAGALYLVLALLVRCFGIERVRSFFPPVVTGPMIMNIGLTLAPSVIAGNIVAGPAETLLTRWAIAGVVVVIMVVTTVFARGFFKLVPILVGIVGGFLVAALFGSLDFTAMNEAKLFAVPSFTLPVFDLRAIALIAPVAIVTFMEHIGDITTNGKVVGKDFLKDPGLHRTLLGDGLATMLAGALGGPANTTYSENTGVLAVTRNYDPMTLRVAAVLAVLLSFVAKFAGFLGCIPLPVMGGVSIVLFGMIATIGLRTLAEAQLDFTHSRNLVIVALMLVIGIGVEIPIGGVTISGLAISAVVGLILNKVMPKNV